MSITIYAAKADKDNAWGPVVDFKHSKFTILAPNAEGLSQRGEDPFLPNPDYIPGASMDMSEGNWLQLLRSVIYISEDAFLKMSLHEARKLVLEALQDKQNDYTSQRLVQLLNVLELGISRGAERLIAA